jgi:citrate lyase subunit beta/citryl-CoA lyase
VSELPAGPAWLFCPADRAERFGKAADAADVVILDLEDGVAAAARPAARRNLLATELDPGRVVVRINPVGTGEHEPDLDAVWRSPFRTVMLAKTESGAQVDSLAGLTVVALCETPLGVLNASEIAASPLCAGLMWGAEDLLAGLGGSSSRHPDGRYRDVAVHTRSTTLIAASASGKAALDSVYLDIADLPGLAVEAADAAESGFSAKVSIHPRQVEVVRRAYSISPERRARAQRIVDAASEADAHGVFALDGQMVDEPVLRQARLLLARTVLAP